MALSIRLSLISATVALAASMGCDHADRSSAVAEAGTLAPTVAAAAEAGTPISPMPVVGMYTDGGAGLTYGDAGASAALSSGDAGASAPLTYAMGSGR
jgi:hypothetical protein